MKFKHPTRSRLSWLALASTVLEDGSRLRSCLEAFGSLIAAHPTIPLEGWPSHGPELNWPDVLVLIAPDANPDVVSYELAVLSGEVFEKGEALLASIAEHTLIEENPTDIERFGKAVAARIEARSMAVAKAGATWLERCEVPEATLEVEVCVAMEVAR